MPRHSGPAPSNVCESDPRTEENAEDELVVSGQPQGQIDVEVVVSLVGETTGQRRQRTAPSIDHQDGHFHEDDSDEPGRGPVMALPRDHGYCEDATSEECPRDGVDDLDRDQQCRG